MTIILRVDNFDALSDGGPIQYQSNGRGFDVGRDTYLDWTLPDPDRYVSGKHCEVRFENGAYHLYDVSTNGTYVNGSSERVKSPYRLQDGDRLTIGRYVLAVQIPGQSGTGPAAEEGWTPQVQPASYQSDDIWANEGAAPPPMDRRELVPPKQRAPREAGFEAQFVDLPRVFEGPPAEAAIPPPAASDPSAAGYPPPPGPVPGPPQGAPWDMPRPQRDPGLQGGFAGMRGESEPFAPQEPAPPPAPQDMAPPVQPFAPPSEPPFTPPPEQPFAPPPVAPAPAPMPRPAVPQPAAPAPSAGGDVIRDFARGARINPGDLSHLDPAAFAEELGAVMRVVVEHLAVLLAARAKAKKITRSANRTMLAADGNNPLKFLPSPDEILTVMFARSRKGFLDAQSGVSEAFSDLEKHEFATIFAMQKALGKLLEDLAPEAIEADTAASTFSSKKAKAWELFVKRWEDKNEPYENGILDVFLTHFSEFYDQQSRS